MTAAAVEHVNTGMTVEAARVLIALRARVWTHEHAHLDQRAVATILQELHRLHIAVSTQRREIERRIQIDLRRRNQARRKPQGKRSHAPTTHKIIHLAHGGKGRRTETK